jgi:hypothetical protein
VPLWGLLAVEKTCGEHLLTLPLRPVGFGPVSLDLGCYVFFSAQTEIIRIREVWQALVSRIRANTYVDSDQGRAKLIRRHLKHTTMGIQ